MYHDFFINNLLNYLLTYLPVTSVKKDSDNELECVTKVIIVWIRRTQVPS